MSVQTYWLEDYTNLGISHSPFVLLMYQSTPGVYREDIFPTPEPELLTGVPAFLGFTGAQDANQIDIPVNQAQQLTLWPQFEQKFGAPLSDSYLSHAVEGFFRNGGSLCYVLRLNDQVSVREALSSGLEALGSLDTIDLICVPDIRRGKPSDEEVRQLQMAVLAHCEEMGDRFAILDCAWNSTVEKVQSQAQSLELQGRHGALYFPWVKIENGPQNTFGYVPPCGHIAGVYALSDREVGVHNAPANYPLEGVLDLSLNLSNTKQEALKSKSVETMSAVNCLRALPGRGIRIWGARTLSQQAQWRYVNVQRLFLTVGRWVERNLASVAFEPNDFSLWIRIERELTGYLASLLQQGALKGGTPSEAFYVKCDRETNPPEVQDAGVVVTEIGLAPTIPNEFIVVRLIHGSTGVSLA